MNFDETCLFLDSSTIRRGSHPEVCWSDPCLPQVEKTPSKTAQRVTMIMGSNTWGEALPLHFHFMSKTKTKEGMPFANECYLLSKDMGSDRRKIYCQQHLKSIKKEEWTWMILQCTFGHELSLYPKVVPDKKGKWVILKCNSGPGQMNIELLVEL
jgi:hypothetical protein